MSRRLLLAIAIVVIWPSIATATHALPPLSQLEEAIKRDLPRGTALGTVIDFLEERHIDYEDSRLRAGFTGPRTVWATVTHKTWMLFFVRDTLFTFEFDSDGRLASYQSRSHLVGP